MSSRASAPPRCRACRAAGPRARSAPPGRREPRATSSACLTSRNRSPRSFEAEPSTPSPTRTLASSSARTRRDARPEPQVGRGQCATAVPASRRRRAMSGVGEMDAVRAPDVAVEPAELARGTRPAGSRRAPGSTPPPRPSRRGACAASARAAARSSADCRIRPPVTENGEHGATTELRGSCAARRSVSARISSASSTSESGGSPPSDSPRSIEPRDGHEPHAQLPRRRASRASIRSSTPRGKT